MMTNNTCDEMLSLPAHADGRHGEPTTVVRAENPASLAGRSRWLRARPRRLRPRVWIGPETAGGVLVGERDHARVLPECGYAGFVGHRLLVGINTTRARPWGNVGDVDIAEFGCRTAVPLIVICQCAVVRRVVAP